MISIKENQNNKLDITIDNRQYLNIPSSQPKNIVVANSGKGYVEGQYYIKLGFEWTKEEDFYDIFEEYNEEEFRFYNIETLFSFLRIYLNYIESRYNAK